MTHACVDQTANLTQQTLDCLKPLTKPKQATESSIAAAFYDLKRFETCLGITTSPQLNIGERIAAIKAAIRKAENTVRDNLVAPTPQETAKALKGSELMELKSKLRLARFAIEILWDIINDRDFKLTPSEITHQINSERLRQGCTEIREKFIQHKGMNSSCLEIDFVRADGTPFTAVIAAGTCGLTARLQAFAQQHLQGAQPLSKADLTDVANVVLNAIRGISKENPHWSETPGSQFGSTALGRILYLLFYGLRCEQTIYRAIFETDTNGSYSTYEIVKDSRVTGYRSYPALLGRPRK